MIKGCLLKFVIIFTILLAAAVYIVQNKIEKLFITSGDQLAISVVEDGWKNSLEYSKNTPEKESLKSLLGKYINGIKSAKDIKSYKFEDLIKILDVSFKDSLIQRDELAYISKIINDVLKNEK